MQGRWLHIRFWRRPQIPRNQQDVPYPPRTPAVHGRLHVAIRQASLDGVVRAELLLAFRLISFACVHSRDLLGYRCGNSASILEVGPGGSMYFNVFEAAPENDRDGPSQQAAQNANGKVGFVNVGLFRMMLNSRVSSYRSISYSRALLRATEQSIFTSHDI